MTALTSPPANARGPLAKLFDPTEKFSPDIGDFPQWADMLSRTAREQQRATQACSTRIDQNCVPAQWLRLLDQMRGLAITQQMAIANLALNRVPYVTTEQNWHRSMYWETAFEFLRFGGQCQDYAIAKYELLRAAGVPADLMRIVVLRDTANGLDHAILAVDVDGDPMLLDNLRADIVSAYSVSDYQPYYSINESGWWYDAESNSLVASR